MPIDHLPIVASGQGENLDDKWAAKLAERWIVAIGEAAARDEMKFRRFLYSDSSDYPGNAKALSRWIERLKAAQGNSRLSKITATAKRGRVDIVVDRLRADDGRPPDTDPVAARTNANRMPAIWLTGTRIGFFRDGPGKNERVKERAVATFSRHFITRLIQRHDLSSATELIALIRQIWPTIVFVDLCVAEIKKSRDGSEWFVPVFLRDDRVAILVVSTTGEYDPFDRLVVRTALRLDQLRPEQMEPVTALANFMFATGDHPVAPTDEARELFEAVRNINRPESPSADNDLRIA